MALQVLPIAGFFVLIGLETSGLVRGGVVVALVGGIAAVMSVYHIGLLARGAYLLLRITHEHAHLPWSLAGFVVRAPFIAQFGINIVIVSGSTDPGWIGGTYVGVYAACFSVLVLAIYRYGLFETTPAIGTIGERHIVQKTDDIVFVTDRAEPVITINASACDTLDLARPSTPGG